MFKWWKRWRASKIEDENLREKTLANINEEPWVKVIAVQFEDPSKPTTGYFELDWNKRFVEELQNAGYSGRADEDVVDMWFNDICRGVVGEEPQ